MDPTIEFVCYLAAGACFLLGALGGARKGPATPVSLLPAGLLLWLLPTLWAAGERAI
jgi:hypothetical protein